jgi:hypothetical protein
VFGLIAVIENGIIDIRHAELADEVLQFALAVVRTKTAAGRHPGLPDRALILLTVGFLVADQAARGVLAEDEFQKFLPELQERRRLGQDLHPFLGGRVAG